MQNIVPQGTTTEKESIPRDILIKQDGVESPLHAEPDVDFTAKVTDALSKSEQQPDLIGDFTKTHSLPLINGKNQGLKTISIDTLAGLMAGNFNHLINNFSIVDCRYPYEYEGGHIRGAINIFTKKMLIEYFFHENSPSSSTVIIFHCEFSSKRGPKLYRFMRGHDRNSNSHRYPHLSYPEIYILEGGYKAFYEKYKELCYPDTYTPMDADKDALREFQAIKNRNWHSDTSYSPCLTRPKKVPRSIRSFD